MNPIVITGRNNGYTLISNQFIDRYMVTAGASHLMTYLLLMRLLSDPQEEISVSHMADVLNCYESDILRSLNYWEKQGLMKLTMEGEGKNRRLSGIAILPFPDVKEETKVVKRDASVPLYQDKADSRENKLEVKESLEDSTLPDRKVDLIALSRDNDFSQLMYIINQYIGRPLTPQETETFGWLYDKLGMNTELLEYLVEYCVNGGHRAVRYMEKVALDWHSKNITTVKQAKEEMPLFNKKLAAVFKALGLSIRKASPVEKQNFEKLIAEYPFSQELLVEACERTMMAIHEPNLNYLRTILERWKAAGYSTVEQVKKDDQKKKDTSKEQKKDNDLRPRGNQQRKPGEQFRNFDNRNINYDELLKQLNGED